MNPTLKRYLISSLVTFLAAFFGMLGMQLSAGVPADLTVSIIFGILGIAARAGVKAVVEGAVAFFQKPSEQEG